MTDLRDEARAYFTGRDPGADISVVNKRADRWLEEAGENASLLLRTPGLASARSAIAERVERIEYANPTPTDTPAEGTRTDSLPKAKPFSELDTESQRSAVAEKFDIPIDRLTTNDFRRLRNAMIAHEQNPTEAAPHRKEDAPARVQPVKRIDGIDVSSDAFRSLRPEERIRRLRAAQKNQGSP